MAGPTRLELATSGVTGPKDDEDEEGPEETESD